MMLLAKEAHAELETRWKLLDDRKTAFENETKTAKADIKKWPTHLSKQSNNKYET